MPYKHWEKLVIRIIFIAEAISMADKVIVLSKSPAYVKNTYDIHLDNKGMPTDNRKDAKYNYYYDLIWKDLDKIV